MKQAQPDTLQQAICADRLTRKGNTLEADDRLLMQVRVQELLQGCKVLELAAGDGRWTDCIAAVANRVCAIDIENASFTTPESAHCNVMRLQADPLDLATVQQALGAQGLSGFDAVFIGEFWRHLPREWQEDWLTELGKLLGDGTRLVIVDGIVEDDGSEPVAFTDPEGNTWKYGAAGTALPVIWNTPTDSALRKRFTGVSRDLRLLRLDRFYLLSARLTGLAPRSARLRRRG